MSTGRWQSTTAGKHLAGRRKRDTVPKVLLRSALHAEGARFRLHRQLAKECTPDIVLPGRRLAVFVDGCYWHSCPVHGRRTLFAGPNAALWEEKMRPNKERDIRASALAEDAGWMVLRIWECEVVADPVAAGRRVLSATR